MPFSVGPAEKEEAIIIFPYLVCWTRSSGGSMKCDILLSCIRGSWNLKNSLIEKTLLPLFMQKNIETFEKLKNSKLVDDHGLKIKYLNSQLISRNYDFFFSFADNAKPMLDHARYKISPTRIIIGWRVSICWHMHVTYRNKLFNGYLIWTIITHPLI